MDVTEAINRRLTHFLLDKYVDCIAPPWIEIPLEIAMLRNFTEHDSKQDAEL